VAGLEPIPVPGVMMGVGVGSPMSPGGRSLQPVITQRVAARVRIKGVFILCAVARSHKARIRLMVRQGIAAERLDGGREHPDATLRVANNFQEWERASRRDAQYRGFVRTEFTHNQSDPIDAPGPRSPPEPEPRADTSQDKQRSTIRNSSTASNGFDTNISKPASRADLRSAELV